jgi:hypothetical protein
MTKETKNKNNGCLVLTLLIIGFVTYTVVQEQMKDSKSTKESKVKESYEYQLNNCNYKPLSKSSPPYYKGLVGYIKPDEDFNDNFDFPWMIPTVLWIKDPENNSATYQNSKKRIRFKTRVLVIDEDIDKLKIERNAILSIRVLDDPFNTIYQIRGSNFSLIPYWDCPLIQAQWNAPIMVRIKPNFQPLDENQKPVSITVDDTLIVRKERQGNELSQNDSSVMVSFLYKVGKSEFPSTFFTTIDNLEVIH